MNAEFPTAVDASRRQRLTPTSDDALTIAAISLIAAIACNVIHEGLGHGLTALLSGASSGVLTTVAWSSAVDSKLVEAGGTLANLAAALVFWVVLKTVTASARVRYFLLIACAFNLFSGTGYFFFSGVTDFGDWAVVISGLNPHWLWRTVLVLVGVASYYAAILLIGIGLVRHVGVPRNQPRRLRRLTFIPYVSAIALACIAAVLNPLGIQLLWQSALPATAGGQSGLLWLQYYIPRNTKPEVERDVLDRSYAWLITAAIIAAFYIVVLGRGVTVHR